MVNLFAWGRRSVLAHETNVSHYGEVEEQKTLRVAIRAGILMMDTEGTRSL